MKTIHEVKKLLVLSIFVLGFSLRLNAQDDAARISALEARVAQLERLVETLTQEPGQAANKSLNGLNTAASEPPASDPLPPLSISEAPTPKRDAPPQELLPNLGKIGASAYLDAGINSGPFSLGRGSFLGGGLSLPLSLVPGGRLNYEVNVALAQNSRQLPITSSVAQLINLSVLNALYPAGGVNNIEQAFSGTGAAPFSVTVPANWRLQTLQVVPLALRYDLTHWDHYRFRPYAVIGLSTYVTVSNQVTLNALRQNADLPPQTLQLLQSLFGTNSPLSGALVGGQIATAAELKQHGIPAGQGGIDVGLQTGGGVEFRLRGGLSTSIDSRYNYAPGGTSYNETISRIGWHF